MSVLLRLLRGSGQFFRNHYLSSKSALELLYAPIVSAIGNVVDFMVGTSQFVGIEPAQGACQPNKPVCHLSRPDLIGKEFIGNLLINRSHLYLHKGLWKLLHYQSYYHLYYVGR